MLNHVLFVETADGGHHLRRWVRRKKQWQRRTRQALEKFIRRRRLDDDDDDEKKKEKKTSIALFFALSKSSRLSFPLPLSLATTPFPTRTGGIVSAARSARVRLATSISVREDERERGRVAGRR